MLFLLFTCLTVHCEYLLSSKNSYVNWEFERNGSSDKRRQGFRNNRQCPETSLRRTSHTSNLSTSGTSILAAAMRNLREDRRFRRLPRRLPVRRRISDWEQNPQRPMLRSRLGNGHKLPNSRARGMWICPSTSNMNARSLTPTKSLGHASSFSLLKQNDFIPSHSNPAREGTIIEGHPNQNN